MCTDLNIDFVIICKEVKEMLQKGEFEACDKFLCVEIGKYPHSAILQNLFGLLLEQVGDHSLAMKHFRAAWALDPTYLPARYNLEIYGTFSSLSNKNGAFDETDCPPFTENKVIKKDMTQNRK